MTCLLATGLAGAALIAGACGSGDEEAPTTTTSTTSSSTDPEPPSQPQEVEAGSPAPSGAEPAPEQPSEPEAAPTPDEGEFLAAADAICADLNAEAGDPPTETLPEIEVAARRSQDLVATGLRRLEELEPAPGLEVIFGQFVAAVSDQQEIVADLADAAAAGDVARVQAVALEVEAASERKNQIALAAGLEECGSIR